MLEYFAHTTKSRDESTWQPLKEHLDNVGFLTSSLCKKFGAGEIGLAVGMMHDIGKYSNEFQKRLRGDPTMVDHSTAGAQLASNKYGVLGTWMAYCVAGHHTELLDWISLKKRLSKEIHDYDQYKNYLELPNIPECGLKISNKFDMYVFVKMLFSCLIDADRIDTERFVRKSQTHDEIQESVSWPTISEIKINFDAYIQNMQNKPVNKINHIRNEILNSSIQCGQRNKGVFTLTVPTGGGKTLASLAFALEHAKIHKLDRVIYVVPYMSITHQNANVFRKAVGDDAVLEHHSSFKMPSGIRYEEKEKIKYAEGNWNAPLIVTTAVQFFESLFSNKPSKSRKIHNIANSVIILDEAQNIPLHLLTPCVAMLNSLLRYHGTTIVLCTATQPALLKADGFHDGFENVYEISPDPKRIYNDMKRTSIVHLGEITDVSIATRIMEHKNVLCIVNTRRHAWKLHQIIKQNGITDGFCLTALMCPEHRKRKINEIKRRLDNHMSCIVVSTNLIEAGVDIDFDVVYREITGLDSIAQAAGRCNREGRNKTGNVYVFESSDPHHVPVEMQRITTVCKDMMEDAHDDLLSLGTIRKYFQMLYWAEDKSGLDREKILDSIRVNHKLGVYELAFSSIARKFKMIDDGQESIIIPFDSDARTYIDKLSGSDYPRSASRDLQPYIIQVREKDFEKLKASERIIPIASEKFGDQFWVLNDMKMYDDATGLSMIFDM